MNLQSALILYQSVRLRRVLEIPVSVASFMDVGLLGRTVPSMVTVAPNLFVLSFPTTIRSHDSFKSDFSALFNF